ncbi:hypothetical protein GCK72_008654 [Caenorhabditis remanei]|uniref:DNA-directed DNA polymerase n=1 Tax=Caenorhabditis remanei TaxID=31234 RepID=A0A6A5H0L1_CAERE|nr:hypothetical protein GCK72_008654 [Caenorhabditis remanei]KAF1760405.1 hypothetical protein GCK72_008654 [Caenorhabditis remanei]
MSVVRRKFANHVRCRYGYKESCAITASTGMAAQNVQGVTIHSLLRFFSMEEEDTGEQVPVLFVALRYCKSCSTFIPTNLQDAAGSVCEHCAPNGRCKVINCVSDETRFTNVADKATEWIFSKENSGFVGIAHNASGYDAQFILKSLISRNKASPAVIMAGTKIVSLKYKGVKLIDSLKYLTMSLAAVGKAFRIPTEKGDFPVKFIKRENFDYVGDIPEDKFSNLEHKSTAARQKLTDFLKEERAQNLILRKMGKLLSPLDCTPLL